MLFKIKNSFGSMPLTPLFSTLTRLFQWFSCEQFSSCLHQKKSPLLYIRLFQHVMISELHYQSVRFYVRASALLWHFIISTNAPRPTAELDSSQLFFIFIDPFYLRNIGSIRKCRININFLNSFHVMSESIRPFSSRCVFWVQHCDCSYHFHCVSL